MSKLKGVQAEAVKQVVAVEGWDWGNMKLTAPKGFGKSKSIKDSMWGREYDKVKKLASRCDGLPSLSSSVWIQKLKKVQKFLSEHGKLPSRFSKDEDVKRLGNWCARQKALCARGQVCKGQKQTLASLPGWQWS